MKKEKNGEKNDFSCLVSLQKIYKKKSNIIKINYKIIQFQII